MKRASRSRAALPESTARRKYCLHACTFRRTLRHLFSQPSQLGNIKAEFTSSQHDHPILTVIRDVSNAISKSPIVLDEFLRK